MQILSNPHTHTSFVDGKNTAAEMAQEAYRLGFVSLGFSEHALQHAGCGLRPENEALYIAEISRLRAEYAGRMRVWLGIERDCLSVADPGKFDYFLGAYHDFVAEDGDIASVDGDAQTLENWVARHLGGDWEKAIQKFFGEYADYIVRICPDIIAHFDLIVKSNRTRHWFDEDSPAFINAGREAMERMITVCDVMELNTGGTARSHQPLPYPVPRLLTYWRQLGGRVIPSSDCHRAHQLSAWFDRVPAYLRAAGFQEMLRLGSGDELFETVPLD